MIPQGVRQIAPVLAHGEKAIGDGPVRADGGLYVVFAQSGGGVDIHAGHIVGVEFIGLNQVSAANSKVPVPHHRGQHGIQGLRHHVRQRETGVSLLQPGQGILPQAVKDLVATEVLVCPVGGAQEGEGGLHVLPGLLHGQVLRRAMGRQQKLHLPICEGGVLVGKGRRPGGDVQGLPLLDDGPALLVDRVQKGVEVHRRGRGGCGLGCGFRRGGAPRQQGEAQGQGEQPPVHSSTLPFSPSR